jgi:thiol-disulfide isomerase/thioredoxin
VEVLTHNYERMMEEEATFIKNFLSNHGKSLASLAIVEKLDKDRYLDVYQKLDASLSKALPKSAYVLDYHKRVEELARFAPGTLAPDIKLNTPDGQELALSSLRGKVVLLDFWASWCGPCRRENPNVVRIYDRYKEKGFTVYSVSLDKNKGNWTEAIQKDRLTWTHHVSDLGYWNSSVVPLYKIEGIPLTFLLDKEGKIVAKGLRDKELEKKVAELLSR